MVSPRVRECTKRPKGARRLPRPVLTIEETAAIFGASIKMIRRAIKDGELETVKIGRTTFVLREPLEQKLKADLSGFGSARKRVRKTPTESS